ncbi:hypothetical protein GCM10025795_52380 [Verticiella sediminum]
MQGDDDCAGRLGLRQPAAQRQACAVVRNQVLAREGARPLCRPHGLVRGGASGEHGEKEQGNGETNERHAIILVFRRAGMKLWRYHPGHGGSGSAGPPVPPPWGARVSA